MGVIVERLCEPQPQQKVADKDSETSVLTEINCSASKKKKSKMESGKKG